MPSGDPIREDIILKLQAQPSLILIILISQVIKNLPKATKLKCGRAETGTQVSMTPNSLL